MGSLSHHSIPCTSCVSAPCTPKLFPALGPSPPRASLPQAAVRPQEQPRAQQVASRPLRVGLRWAGLERGPQDRKAGPEEGRRGAAEGNGPGLAARCPWCPQTPRPGAVPLLNRLWQQLLSRMDGRRWMQAIQVPGTARRGCPMPVGRVSPENSSPVSSSPDRVWNGSGTQSPGLWRWALAFSKRCPTGLGPQQARPTRLPQKSQV